MGEDRSWHLRLSGRRNLEFFAALYPLQGGDERLDRLLHLVGMDLSADRPVSQYSTGMRARLGLARALLRAAPVLVLDEPSRILDPEGREACHRMLQGLMASQGICVVIASHDAAEVGGLAGQVLEVGIGSLARGKALA
jgi:ABC-2 type transport system ATP-binding protein